MSITMTMHAFCRVFIMPGSYQMMMMTGSLESPTYYRLNHLQWSTHL